MSVTLVVVIGGFMSGIACMIGFDEDAGYSPESIGLFDAIKDAVPYPDGEHGADYYMAADNSEAYYTSLSNTHYDKVDRDGKYYMSMTGVQLQGSSIRVTFDGSHFESPPEVCRKA